MALSFTTFYINDKLYALDIRYIREINQNLEVSKVDLAPTFITGLLNLRGQIITVMDLPYCIGFDNIEIGKDSHCLVLKDKPDWPSGQNQLGFLQKEKIGLLVDKVGDIVNLAETDIEPVPANVTGIHSDMVDGIIKQNDNLIIVLNLLNILEQKVAKSNY